MNELIHHLIARSARTWPDRPALRSKADRLTYAELARLVDRAARALVGLGLERGGRVAIYLDKRAETVIAIFGAAMAGGVFVPINPLLRPRQVGHILRDCGASALVTSPDRLRNLGSELESCPDLNLVVATGSAGAAAGPAGARVVEWDETMLGRAADDGTPHRVIDDDVAAILYTSGSTGAPKGVVLSHRNLVAGAISVAEYLENDETDRILSVLPLSFDAGLSQLTTAFHVGAKVVLMDFLMPRDVVRICDEERITGLTGVPPLWIQLAELEWPESAARSLRYFANTGGHMPRPVLDKLRALFPQAKPYLMYGLTEAFRSTYLDPAEVDRRPNSIGKAIPNAEILVVREDGTPCAPGEHGELVHRGALVAMGYWKDPDRTAERFRSLPRREAGLPLAEIAVWSGDIVYTDEEGFIYFVGRRDEMIKTSGYRVSPSEIEEVIYGTGMVEEAVALGLPHPTLGQGIVVAVAPADIDLEALKEACGRQLPRYMVPEILSRRQRLPRGPNGKIDRGPLKQEFSRVFEEAAGG